ncbi:hypothetical protein EDC18_101194 [Natranaerovirga pectinivora]|uniref:Type IV pilus assembly protein PilO n=1 Tax=Natranaerovirga pectinivora TaxID=682400 RepID=A0A4R3MRS3_9FIRM|nr:hypothetical protein [Natranaerovirga pectinivora]TCT16898.1 hypothetical protein EDC18_101194 [Natranaerovirga pectinivora]
MIEKKNKNTLIILGVLLIIIVVYNYGYKPIDRDKKALELEIQQLENQYAILLGKEKNRALLESEIVAYTEQIEAIESMFPGAIHQEKVLSILNHMELTTNILFTNIGLSQEEILLTQNENGREIEASKVDVTVNYETNYLRLKELLNYINEHEDRIVISTINLTEKDEFISVNMNLSFYRFYYEGREIPHSFIPEEFINNIPIGRPVEGIPQSLFNSNN